MTSDCSDLAKAPRGTAAVLIPIGRETPAMEPMVMSWFAAGHELMWIPTIEVGPGPDGVARAQQAAAAIGCPRLLTGMRDLCRLPKGIKGWLLPAHLDDTCVMVVREAAREVTFGSVTHSITGEMITWRTSCEYGVDGLRGSDGAQAATAAAGKSSVDLPSGCHRAFIDPSQPREPNP